MVRVCRQLVILTVFLFFAPAACFSYRPARMGNFTSTSVGRFTNHTYTHFIQDVVSHNCVVIFSKTTCPYCKMAKNVFNQIGATYKVIELDEHRNGQQIQDALAQMSGARTSLSREKMVPKIMQPLLETDQMYRRCAGAEGFFLNNCGQFNCSGRAHVDLLQREKQMLFIQVPRVFVNGLCIGGGSDTRQLHEQGKLVPLIEMCNPCCLNNAAEGSGSGHNAS